ncbi:MAG: fused MFS/spermidine synthase [Pseudomonadota bacterium]
MTPAPWPVRLPATRALVLMAASGFAGLGYQIVWTRQAGTWLGHEWPAVLAVVAAFFGGLAIGAAALGARIDRSRFPARWYAGCEAVIGSWGVALAFLVAPAGEWLQDRLGEDPSAFLHWSIAFFGTFVLLLPATAAMGATLPAMERLLQRTDGGGTPIAGLYAANTLGAVAGVLVAAFWLVPALGLAATAFVCAALNIGCALAAPALGRSIPAPATRHGSGSAALYPTASAPHSEAPARQRLMFLLAATGLLGIGYEVVTVRVLSQVSENTIYTFAMLLAIYLAGTALGAAAYHRWQHAGTRPTVGVLPGLLAPASLVGLFAMGHAEGLREGLMDVLGPGLAAALTGEAALAAAAFLVPTFVMGAVFTHLCTQARAAGMGLGQAIGINTLGAAIAPLLFGVLLVPAIGTRTTLLLVAVAYLALFARGSMSRAGAGAVTAAIGAAALLAPPLVFVDVPEGGRVIHHREGSSASVSVVMDAGGVARLHIDNRQQEGSSATRFGDSRQALLPILLHPAPARALFLGVGTGVTSASATGDPRLDVDAVELLPEVIEATRLFRAAGIDAEADAGADARLHLKVADARRYVRATARRYDVIVSDNFHPARSGSGSLYTREHFTAIRQRLEQGGVFCQWLPLHQLDRESLRSIVRTFIEVFPDGWAMLATNSLETPVVGLVARIGADRFDIDRVGERLQATGTSDAAAAAGIEDAFALLGSFIAGPRSLAAFSSGARMNTDDRTIVTWLAPRITYAPDSLPKDRLIGLLRELQIAPAELLNGGQDGAFPARLAAYWAARNRFIEAGRDIRPLADVQRMLAQVESPLLEALRASPDFRPAYDPLLQMAEALARVDGPAARTLLAELQRLQPARPEAGRLLHGLGPP